MQALQHHYTSCRNGASGSAGFQTRTSTTGLRPDEQREIERRGIYTPPRNMKPDPGPEDILYDFPKAFRYYPLESGRWALTFSCYVGQDYSGRWGNYFAHTLVGEGDTPPNWPIDYYEWQGWKTALLPDEDTDELPPPLALVDLKTIPPSEAFILPELKEFLKEAPGRQGFLADMVRAVFMRQETSRALVIRDSFLNGLFWIACIQKAFPPASLREVSFSTYQFDDRNCASINVTTEGTDFTFDESQRKYQFFMFDFINGQHSEVPKGEPDYAGYVTEWMSKEPEKLARFHEFLTLFNCLRPEPEFVWAVRLFQATSEGEPPLKAEELGPVIEFVSRFTTAAGRDQVIDWMRKLTPLLFGSARASDYVRFVKFFAEAGCESGNPRYRQFAFAAWSVMFDDLVLSRGKEIEAVKALREELRSSFAEHELELARIFLADIRMQQIKKQLSDLSPGVIEEVFYEVVRSLEVLKRVPVWNDTSVKEIIIALMGARSDAYATARRIFDVAAQDTDALVGICRLIASRNGGANSDLHDKKLIGTGRALKAFMDRIPEPQASAVRRQLDVPGTWNVLYGEWLERLDKGQDKRQEYEQYLRREAGYLTQYAKTYREPIAQSLLRCLDEEQQCQQAISWVLNKEVEVFSAPFARTCLALANLSIPFDPKAPGAKKNAAELSKAVIDLKVRLKPDRPLLLNAVFLVQRGDVSLTDLPLEEVYKNLREDVIDPRSYTIFLANFLKEALGRAKQGHEHKEVLGGVYNRIYFDRFRFSYLEFFESRRKKPFTKSDEAAIVFWLAHMWRDRTFAGLSDLGPDVWGILVNRICSLDDDQFAVLDRNIFNRNDELDRGAFLEWNSVIEHRSVQSRGLLGRVFSKRK